MGLPLKTIWKLQAVQNVEPRQLWTILGFVNNLIWEQHRLSIGFWVTLRLVI